MSAAVASQITSLTIVYSTVYLVTEQRKHRHWPLCGEFIGDRWIPRKKWPVTRKRFPFDDFIMLLTILYHSSPPLLLSYEYLWQNYLIIFKINWLMIFSSCQSSKLQQVNYSAKQFRSTGDLGNTFYFLAIFTGVVKGPNQKHVTHGLNPNQHDLSFG